MTNMEIIPAGEVMLLPVGSVQDGKTQMARFQQECEAVLTSGDWQGPPGQKGSFVKKSGWRKLAMRYAISCELIHRSVERDADGTPVRAEATVRAVHKATGQSQDADGYCAITEPRFRSPSGRFKLENDLRGTATTRAKNRAISDLIGYGQVSAEEADGGEETKPYGPKASPNEISHFERAIGLLYAGETTHLQTLIDRLEQDAGGYIPKIVARAVMLTAAHRPSPQEPEEAGTDAEGTPEKPTPPPGDHEPAAPAPAGPEDAT